MAYRARPVYAPDGHQQDNMSKYQSQLEPMRRLLMIGVPVVIGVFAATAVTSQWKEVLLFFNQVPFNETDPQFHMDLGFYIFTLPFLGLLIGYLISVVLIAGIAGLLTHYLYGGIRVEERGGIVVGNAARIHIAVFAVAFLLLQAGNFWLDRYSTLLSQNGRVAGASVHRRARGDPHQDDPGDRRGACGDHVHRHRDHRALAPADHRHRDAAGDGCRRRRHLPVHRAAVPGHSVGKDPGARVHREEHPDDPPGVRPDRRRGDRLQRRGEPEEGRASQGQSNHHEHPPAGPEPRLLGVRPAAAVPDLLQVRPDAERRPLRHRRQDRRHGDRRARAQRRPHRVLGQPAHHLHPRLRRGGRLRQPRDLRRTPGLHAQRHPHRRRAGQRQDLRTAHLLRRALSAVLDRRRPRGLGSARA